MVEQEIPSVSTESRSPITMARVAIETARLRVIRKVGKTRAVLTALGPKAALESLAGITPQEPKHGRAQELFGSETARTRAETLRGINCLDKLRAERDAMRQEGRTESNTTHYNYVLRRIKELETGLLKK